MQIICTLLQTDNHVSTSSLNFFTGRMLFLTPNNSVKAQKEFLEIFIVSHCLSYNKNKMCHEWCIVKTYSPYFIVLVLHFQRSNSTSRYVCMLPNDLLTLQWSQTSHRHLQRRCRCLTQCPTDSGSLFHSVEMSSQRNWRGCCHCHHNNSIIIYTCHRQCTQMKTRYRVSTSTRWHFAFGTMLS